MISKRARIYAKLIAIWGAVSFACALLYLLLP